MCVEAHYLATDAAAGRAEKRGYPLDFKKKQRFIEVNCRLNIPWSTIGEERETKLPSKLTYVKLKFFLVRGSRGAFYSDSSRGARFSSTYL